MRKATSMRSYFDGIVFGVTAILQEATEMSPSTTRPLTSCVIWDKLPTPLGLSLL